MSADEAVASDDARLSAVVRLWLDEPKQLTAVVRGRRLDETTVADLERVVSIRRHQADTTPGNLVLAAAHADLDLVMHLLANASYTEQFAVRLHVVAAEHARLAGITAFDLGDVLGAHFSFGVALRAAHTCGNRSLGALILGHMAEATTVTDGPRVALNVLRAAEQAADAALSHVERALLVVRQARTHARVGDGEAMEAAIDWAFRAWEQAGDRPVPPYARWIEPADLHGRAGHALLIAGQAERAHPYLGATVRALRRADARPKHLALAMARLAAAELALGDVMAACVTAAEATDLVERFPSARLVEAVCDVALKMAPYRGNATVMAFIERATALARDSQRAAAAPSGPGTGAGRPPDEVGPRRPFF